MKKNLILISTLAVFFAAGISAQEQTNFFDEDGIFGQDDFLFDSDDDFFGEDSGIDEIKEVSAKTDLSKGVLFENGSIKIGGNFTTSIATQTVLYSPKEKSFKKNFEETKLTPNASAFLSLDARPNQNLRMYTKFGLQYPFKESVQSKLVRKNYMNPYEEVDFNTEISTSFKNWFSLKELFTDFSIADTAFFRFGLHTVTWGTGLFFSPVSDLINTSSINPEDTSAQVDGSLNLRTQIVFPGTQNCLWLYLIPSTNFTSSTTAESYARDTALAGKVDLVFGGWEFGLGGFYKYQNVPKAMLTASGSLKNLTIFGEFVYGYGSDSQWTSDPSWNNKTNIFQATVGLSRYWKNPAILAAAQYYYDGNDLDAAHAYLTYGHNVAGTVNFGKILGNSDITANIFGMVNFGKKDVPSMLIAAMPDISSLINVITLSAMVNYTPVSAVKIGMGPYVTWSSFKENPTVSLKLSATLGGGKF